jgi:hypothetical protein
MANAQPMNALLTSPRALPVTWLVAAAAASLIAAQDAGPPRQPTFRTGVDLIRLDVTVVGSDGSPVDSLHGDDFDVRVKGGTGQDPPVPEPVHRPPGPAGGHEPGGEP